MISVFDEQWFRMPPLEYADKLQANNVSDVYPLVWSTHWVGDGPSTTWEHKEEFPDFVSACHSRGIRVNAAFNTCRIVQGFPSFNDSFADVTNADFQKMIADSITEITGLVDGICLDFIRTDDPNGRSSVTDLIRRIRSQVKIYNKPISACVIPWRSKWPDAIQWANDGLVDVLITMNYGSPQGGDPELVKQRAVDVAVDIPVIMGVSCYQMVDGIPEPSTRFDKVERIASDKYMIYPGWLWM